MHENFQTQLRRLAPGEEAKLDAFLAQHAASSVFLRQNLRITGLQDNHQPQQGTYLGAFRSGELVGVAAQYWSGKMILQAPEAADLLAPALLAETGRRLSGLLGPWPQIAAARPALGSAAKNAPMDSCETLYILNLDQLRVPDALMDPSICCRASRETDLDLLLEWRMAYIAEAMNQPDDRAHRMENWQLVQHSHSSGRQWLLEAGGKPVASVMFHAALPDIVQIGGAWTPPAQRGHGYASLVLAGALLAVRQRGVRQATFLASSDHKPAIRAYEKLGFTPAGDYGLVVFASD